MTVQPAELEIGRVNDLIARARALIFDVDGPLAETEETHRQAFNEAFVKAGIDWCWGRAIYKELLRVAGGKERIRAFDRMRGTEPMLSDPEIAELHRIKTARYVELVAGGGCPLRPGVETLMAGAKHVGRRLAIATTTSRANIQALLSVALGEEWAGCFDAIVAGDEVPRKKPLRSDMLKLIQDSRSNRDEATQITLDQINTLRADALKEAKESNDKAEQALREEVSATQAKLAAQINDMLNANATRSDALVQRADAMKKDIDEFKTNFDEDHQNISNISPGIALFVALVALVLGPHFWRIN